MIKEEWKDIVGYPEYVGLYAVSNLGQVKSLRRPSNITTGNSHSKVKGFREERILKPFNSRRYLVIKLCSNTIEKTVHIHRLVAKAFIPIPQKYIEAGLTVDDLEVNHLDGDPSNNNVSNLEWCTKQENMKHAKLTGLMPKGKKGGLSPRARKVAMYDLQGNLIKVFNSLTDVSFFFTGSRKGSSHITAVCRGQRYTSFCHIFRYVLNEEAVETKLSVHELPKNSLDQIKRKDYDTFRSAGHSLKE